MVRGGAVGGCYLGGGVECFSVAAVAAAKACENCGFAGDSGAPEPLEFHSSIFLLNADFFK